MAPDIKTEQFVTFSSEFAYCPRNQQTVTQHQNGKGKEEGRGRRLFVSVKAAHKNNSIKTSNTDWQTDKTNTFWRFRQALLGVQPTNQMLSYMKKEKWKGSHLSVHTRMKRFSKNKNCLADDKTEQVFKVSTSDFAFVQPANGAMLHKNRERE